MHNTAPLFYADELGDDDGEYIAYRCCHHCTHPLNRPMQHAHPLACCKPNPTEGDTP